MVLNTEDFSSELVHGMTFKKFFAAFYNNIDCNRSLFKIKDFKLFKKYLLKHIDTIVIDVISIFCKFNIVINLSDVYYY